MVFNKNSKAFRKDKKPTKLPKSATAAAHPHIKMITPSDDSSVGVSNADASPEPPIPARSKRNGKGKSKIPKSARSNHYRDSTVIRTRPITIVQVVPSSLQYINTPVVNSYDSDSIINDNNAKEVVSDGFASPDLDLNLPLSLQHQTPTVLANMSSPLAGKGKCLPTTCLSTSEPAAIKGIITPSTSPQLPSGQMASQVIHDIVPNSYESYKSFIYTPPHSTPTSLPLQSDQNPKDSSPSRPLPKTSKSTPLLLTHGNSIRASQKSHRSTLSHGFYEYHTISGTVTVQRTSEHGEAGSGSCSGYVSGSESGTGSTPTSSRSSLREKFKMLCGMKPSLLCAYILCGFCLVWLMWMSWTTISQKETGNRGGVGSNGIGGHFLPYGAEVPAVTPFKDARAVTQLVPTAEAISSNFGLNTQVDRIDEITTSQVDKALNRHCDEESKREDMKINSILWTWFALPCAYVVAILIFIVLASEAMYVSGWAKKIPTKERFGEKV